MSELEALQPGTVLEVVHQEGEKGWTDKVLAMLDKDEILDGMPTTDGLRRVATELYGPIQSKTTVHAVVQNYAAVTVELQFGHDCPPTVGPVNDKGCCLGTSAMFARRVSGSAECSESNSTTPYINSPLATAESKATGRALRAALCLKGIYTAEEKAQKEGEGQQVVATKTGALTESQQKFIHRYSKDLNVDPRKVIDLVIGLTPFNELTQDDGYKISEQLNRWRSGEENLPNEEKVGVFSEDWLSNIK